MASTIAGIVLPATLHSRVGNGAQVLRSSWSLRARSRTLSGPWSTWALGGVAFAVAGPEIEMPMFIFAAIASLMTLRTSSDEVNGPTLVRWSMMACAAAEPMPSAYDPAIVGLYKSELSRTRGR